MKRLIRKFIYNQEGIAGPAVFVGALFAVFAVIMLTIAIPMAIDSHNRMNFQTALSILSEAGYVAYGAPTGDWTTLGDLYTQDIFAQADDTYDIGSSTARYQDVYAPIGREATITVAASNASNSTIAQADYICDGTADDVQINAALAALAVGGKVRLSEGTFTIVDPVDIPDDNITLSGCGASTFIDGDGLAATENAIEISNRDDVVIRDLSLQTADGGGNTINGILIQDGSDRFIIENVTIIDCDSDAIHIEGTTITGGLIADCVISDADDAGIYVNMDAVNSIQNVIVRNNIITGTGEDGIDMQTTGQYYYGWSIIANSISFAGQSGMFLGTDFQYSTITGNTIHDNSNNGIEITAALRLSLTGNFIYNNVQHGIDITDSGLINITGNDILGNDSGNANTYDGIYAINSSYLNISSNFLWANDRNGVWIRRSSYCSIIGNVLTANTQGDAIKVEGDGTNNSDYNTIDGNVCQNQGDDGIEIVGGGDANHNIVTNNITTGNAGTNIVDGGTSTMVRDNEGWITENSGTATLLNGNTSVTVAHGLSATPTIINITFAENPTNLMADWWVDTVGAANFVFNGVDPGASNLDFYWEAKVR